MQREEATPLDDWLRQGVPKDQAQVSQEGLELQQGAEGGRQAGNPKDLTEAFTSFQTNQRAGLHLGLGEVRRRKW